MRAYGPPLRLTGAKTLRDGALQRRSVAIERGKITKGPLPEVDLSGYLILPGIIDLHGDAFERHLAPRPSAPFPAASALKATDMEAAMSGVTTAWLAHGWSWEGGLRSPEACEQFLAEWDHARTKAQVDLRVQIRVETHMTDTAERLLSAVQRHGVDYVVFNNHLPQALEAGIHTPARIESWAHAVGTESAGYRARAAAAHDARRDVPRFLCRLADAFDALGVSYGSHDDADGETREMFSMMGAKICEFPVARSAAALARAVGDPVLMGAPNVVRGRSQAGRLAAVDLIRAGLCDGLVSDFYTPALAQAAFRLVDDGVLPLPAAWALISERPAEILRLADRGRIDYGRRADLVIINEATRAIEATLVAGRIVHLTGEAAHRFLGARGTLAMAAE